MLPLSLITTFTLLYATPAVVAVILMSLFVPSSVSFAHAAVLADPPEVTPVGTVTGLLALSVEATKRPLNPAVPFMADTISLIVAAPDSIRILSLLPLQFVDTCAGTTGLLPVLPAPKNFAWAAMAAATSAVVEVPSLSTWMVRRFPE